MSAFIQKVWDTCEGTVEVTREKFFINVEGDRSLIPVNTNGDPGVAIIKNGKPIIFISKESYEAAQKAK